jgi:hypothetical protein
LVGELLRALGRKAVPLPSSENRSGDRVKFWLSSSGDVLLHRASHRRRRALVLLAQCIAVNIGTFCACDCKRLVSATPKTRIFACYPHRCIEGRSRKGHRGEKRELVPQQRELVLASVALDPCPPELGLRRFSTCQLNAEKR